MCPKLERKIVNVDCTLQNHMMLNLETFTSMSMSTFGCGANDNRACCEE